MEKIYAHTNTYTVLLRTPNAAQSGTALRMRGRRARVGSGLALSVVLYSSRSLALTGGHADPGALAADRPTATGARIWTTPRAPPGGYFLYAIRRR